MQAPWLKSREIDDECDLASLAGLEDLDELNIGTGGSALMSAPDFEVLQVEELRTWGRQGKRQRRRVSRRAPVPAAVVDAAASNLDQVC